MGPPGKDGSCLPLPPVDLTDDICVGLCAGEALGDTGGLGPLNREKTLEVREDAAESGDACVGLWEPPLLPPGTVLPACLVVAV